MDHDPACFTVHQDDSSRNVTSKGADFADAPSASPATLSGAAVDVERALARALEAAAVAGRFDIVAQLARELEARRLQCAGNVVKLEHKSVRRVP